MPSSSLDDDPSLNPVSLDATGESSACAAASKAAMTAGSFLEELPRENRRRGVVDWEFGVKGAAGEAGREGMGAGWEGDDEAG